MRSLILSIALILGLVSCKKNSTQSIPPLPAGDYAGTFKRYNINEDKTADIQIKFTKGNWEGGSSINKYPALNKGTYTVSDDALIKFVNGGAWTADFDWTLILNGNYLLHKNDDSLVFTRSYGNGYVDVFKLARLK